MNKQDFESPSIMTNAVNQLNVIKPGIYTHSNKRENGEMITLYMGFKNRVLWKQKKAIRLFIPFMST